MKIELNAVRIGLAMVLLGLLFGVFLGVGFGVNEAMFKDYIANGIALNPGVHDVNSQGKIWRYGQRAHFHAVGIAAFSLGLLVFVTFSSLTDKMKKISSVAIGLGGFYPLAWFSMYLLAPSIGRGAAHSHILTELFTMVGVGGLLVGIMVLIAGLFVPRAGVS